MARSTLKDGLNKLVAGAQATGVRTSHAPTWTVQSSVQPWPMKDDLDEYSATIKRLRGEADTILQELAGLGVDSALFTLNGE